MIKKDTRFDWNLNKLRVKVRVSVMHLSETHRVTHGHFSTSIRNWATFDSRQTGKIYELLVAV